MKNKSSTIMKVAIYAMMTTTVLFFIPAAAQNTEVIEGKLIPVQIKEQASIQGACGTPEESNEIKEQIKQFKTRLEAEGKLDANRVAAFGPHAFRFPLANAKFNHNFSNYYISNYVDLDPSSSGNGSTEDYNCGTRTYDNPSNGYDHDGIDIMLGPFEWTNMDHEDVDVVAAEGGTISAKRTGQFDRTCAWGNSATAGGNYIAITHSDGSSTLYKHMKEGSLTNKDSGDYVSVGEYLGKVGSSGNSTGPHLHFEVQDNFGSIRDPFQNGSCATGTNPSLWANEEPYINPQIMSIFTLSAPWSDPTCDSTGATHGYSGTVPYCNHFNAGDFIWFSAALRDITLGKTVSLKIYNPSGTLISNSTYTEQSSFRSMRVFSPVFIQAPNIAGNYKLQCTFNGVTRAHFFTVGCPGATTLSNTRSSNYGYISGSTINSTDSIVASARNVQYQAEDYIQFNPGFRAVSGCEFTAYIDNCTIGNPKFADETKNANAELDFKLIPNPADGQFKIEASEFNVGDAITVFDAIGKIVYQLKMNDTLLNKSIEASDWDNGIYFVQLSTLNGEKSATKKLIINH